MTACVRRGSPQHGPAGEEDCHPSPAAQFCLQAGLTLPARITSVSGHHVCSARHCSSTTSFRASAATQRVSEPCTFTGDSGHRCCDVPDRKPPSRPPLLRLGLANPPGNAPWSADRSHAACTPLRSAAHSPAAAAACPSPSSPAARPRALGALHSCRPSNALTACSLCPRPARTCSHERSRGAGQHNRPGGRCSGVGALPSQLHCSGD